jgi:hypothetical protein
MNLLKCTSLATALLASSFLAIPDTDRPPAKIQSIAYGGTGAPQGSVGQTISDDRETFTLIFDSFIASQGPGVPITEGRKSAEFTFTLATPHGRSVFSETVRGYAQLPAGVTATVTLTGPHGDGDGIKNDSQRFVGPIAMDYIFSTDLRIHAKTAVEDVKVSIQLSGPHSSAAQFTVDSLDGKLTAPVDNDDDDSGD